jgi:DNA primase large subunit
VRLRSIHPRLTIILHALFIRGRPLSLVNRLPHIRLGTGDLAKYPFLNEASEYIRLIHLDYDEFDRPEMKYIIERSAQRIDREVRQGKLYETLERYEIEVLTFLVSLMMVKCMETDNISKKHSLFEALRAEKFLTEDLKKEQNEDRRQLLISKIFVELFRVQVEINGEDHNLFKVKVNDYLARASKFHEQEWKLINRQVHKGYVYLGVDETVRLIRSELSTLIYNRLKTMDLSAMPLSVKHKLVETAPRFAQEYNRQHIHKISNYPPCVKHAIDEMNKGENLPHSARVLLATYMLSIGKNVEDIVVLFHNAPDFNEKVTRYQIEHLSGKKGSGIKYFVPSCEKLVNESLCFKTEECNGIVNPIQFGQGMRKKID